MFAPSPPELVGHAPAWLETLERVSLAAPLDRPLLVVGERGTGKELVAERIHFLSRRWEGPYVKVNCAALSKDLLDSELFGHEAGAFTGATRRRAGRFELAHGGTLFLDEIATASLEVQEKLLRVIEYGEFQRLGGEDVLTCDVRVIAATNVDLPSRAVAGDFRADLLDRLAFDVVTVPPLRARHDDISVLAEHFGRIMAREMGLSFPGFSRGAMALLETHTWPGNVRELKNAAERAVYRDLATRSPEQTAALVSMTPDMLDPFISAWRPGRDLSFGSQPVAVGAALAPVPVPVPELSDTLNEMMTRNSASRSAPVDFERQVAAFEQQLMDDALAACNGHQKRAAGHLGLSYNQLRTLLRKYGYAKNSPREGGSDEAEENAKPLGGAPKPGM